jgi:DNA-binding transcriptional LysR family regulator
MLHDYIVMFENLFDRQGLSLDRLRTFCEIAQFRGITRAARGNAVRQSQFSRQLKELENYFGTELFVRKRNTFRLTSAGEKLLRVANEFLTSLTTAKSEIQELPQTVSFGAGESIFNWLLFPRYSHLDKLFPDFCFQFRNLQSKEVIRGMQESELDFGIVREDACPRDLQKRKLGAISYCLFLPKALMQTKTVSAQNSLLQDLPLATLEGDGQFKTLLFGSAQKHKIKLNIKIVCSSFPLMTEILKQGHVAAILPSIAEVELPAPMFLRMSVPMLKPMDRQYVLCYRERTLQRREGLQRELNSLVEHLQIGAQC